MATAPLRLASGQVLKGRRASYEISQSEAIGFGGMATIHSAVDVSTKSEVAIKVLANLDVPDRFKREAIIGSALNHPNLVRVLDAGWVQGRPFFVMDLLDGCTLAEFLDRPADTAHQGSDDLSTADREGDAWKIRLALFMARGLAMLHAREIIHRDVKPANIFLCSGPPGVAIEPKLLDFGIAKQLLPGEQAPGAETQHDKSLGSQGYRPPEQQKGDSSRMGFHSDVWALGAVLYRLIEAREFHADQADPAKPPSERWDRRLWGVVAKALQQAPRDRYRTIPEFALALEPFAEGMKFDVGLPSRTAGAARAKPSALTFEALAGNPPGRLRLDHSILVVVAALLLLAGWKFWPADAPASPSTPNALAASRERPVSPPSNANAVHPPAPPKSADPGSPPGPEPATTKSNAQPRRRQPAPLVTTKHSDKPPPSAGSASTTRPSINL